jgi:hypothetical protein
MLRVVLRLGSCREPPADFVDHIEGAHSLFVFFDAALDLGDFFSRT